MTMTLSEQLDELELEFERLKERKCEIFRASLKATEEDDKIGSDELVSQLLDSEGRLRGIQYPIEIRAIQWAEGDHPPFWKKATYATGRWVKIRPCAKEHGNKTYLGVLLGDMALGIGAAFDPEARVLHLRHSHHNPAIYVPDLREVIFGRESWWGVIKSPEDLDSISDADIENVWYVRVLRDLETREKVDAQ